MQITKVNLRPVAMNKVVAIASIVIDDCFVIHDLRIVDGDKGLFVAMPSRKLPSGEFRDICHPINTEARHAIQRSVLAEFAAEGGVAAFSAAAADHATMEHPEISNAAIEHAGAIHAAAVEAEAAPIDA